VSIVFKKPKFENLCSAIRFSEHGDYLLIIARFGGKNGSNDLDQRAKSSARAIALFSEVQSNAFACPVKVAR
jgi:hypothetical protein